MDHVAGLSVAAAGGIEGLRFFQPIGDAANGWIMTAQFSSIICPRFGRGKMLAPKPGLLHSD